VPDAMGSVQRGIEDATCVLSDVAEITGLQQREGTPTCGASLGGGPSTHSFCSLVRVIDVGAR